MDLGDLVMFKYEDFFNDLKASGLKPYDTVMIHSSFSSIKDIEGGAETILRALKDYFCDGLILLPTHTWASMKEDSAVFDKSAQNSCVGYLTNVAIKDPDFIRSNHPTHSVVACGKNAEAYIKDDDYAKTPASPDGSFGKLKNGAKILFIGCPLSKNTFIHSIEEEMDVPQRFTEHIYTFYTKLEDGSMMEFHMPRHYNEYCAHISDNYEKLLPIFIATGACRRVRLLNSTSYLLDAQRAYQIVKNILANDIHSFDDKRDIGEFI